VFVKRIVLVVAFVLACLVVPTPATAAVAPLKVSPAQPIRGQAFTLTGTVTPRFARTVRLQRYTGGRWITSRTTRSTSTGRYTVTITSTAASLTFRAYVPKTKHRGRTYASQKSAKVVVKPASPVPALTVATGAGHTVAAQVVAPPSSVGRTVTVQHLEGTVWVKDRAAAQPASGRTALTFDAPDPGDRQFRAVVTGGGLATSTSAQVPLTIESPVARVDIRTDGSTAITSGETYVPGDLVVDPRGSGLAASTSRGRFRVRGNSTSWVRAKLSYKIKLDTKTSLLGLPASKDWVLLANFYDRSLIRNEVAFQASRLVGLPWTPRLRFAELWVDGSYRGLYQVGEGIEAAQGRVTVPAGGQLLEGDSHEEDDPSFRTTRGFQIFFKDPDDPDAATRTTVAAQVQAVEDALYEHDLSTIDIDSFVDWYIVNELLKNVDSAINNSVWMVLSPDGRLSMGPVWDFDQAMGNRTMFGADRTSGLYTGALFGETAPSQIRLPEGHWFNQLLASDEFTARLRARWSQVRGRLATLPTFVDALTREVRDSAPRNFAQGNGGDGLPIGPSLLDSGSDHLFHESWPAEVAALRSWVDGRHRWLDGELGG
jgi:hypothetical protein